MKRHQPFVVILAALTLAAPARAEYRTVLVRIQQGEGDRLAVTIHSDVKKEQRTAVSVDEAARVLADVVGWGSAVGVYIVREGVSARGEEKKLLQAVVNNLYLELLYLGGEVPKEVKEHFLK